MDVPETEVYFKQDQQNILVEELSRNVESILEISQDFLSKTDQDAGIEQIAQFVIFQLLCLVFGLLVGTAFAIFSSPEASTVRDYIKDWTGTFPGRSTVYLHLPTLQDTCHDLLEPLAAKIQDAFAVAVGNHARAVFAALVKNSRAKVLPPLECFVGITPPSAAFPSLRVKDRGCLLPYFHAWTWAQATRVTSTAEVIGKMKTIAIEGGHVTFREAGEVGFFARPPGKNAFYAAFGFIEAHLAQLDDFLNLALAKLGAIDLTAGTIDTTYIPADERDQSGTPGTSSCGPFYGHKASVGGSARGLPVSNVPGLGRQADSTLFADTFQPLADLARAAGQDMWVEMEDAAFSNTGVVDTTEAASVIPLVDVNPKNSPRLAAVKEAAKALTDLSKKAIEEGLSPDERKEWVEVAQGMSKTNGSPVPLAEKRKLLPRILRKFAERARKKGLTASERRTEKRLRREVAETRREIQNHGTPAEKKVALPPILQGSIEWFLCYHIRGQNEGIFGILKKRGAVIGDGQGTPWVVGQAPVSGRVQGKLTGIKVSALVMVKVTGAKQHFMRALHNWRRTRKATIFVVFFRIDFVGKPPDKLISLWVKG